MFELLLYVHKYEYLCVCVTLETNRGYLMFCLDDSIYYWCGLQSISRVNWLIQTNTFRCVKKDYKNSKRLPLRLGSEGRKIVWAWGKCVILVMLEDLVLLILRSLHDLVGKMDLTAGLD